MQPAVDLISYAYPPVAPQHLVAGFRSVVTPHISDNMHRLSGIFGLQKYHRRRKLVGTAVTVKTRPGDNLAIYKALMDMQPGHVLVVDGGGLLTNALIGDLILKYALKRGCVGFVVDGAIRDCSAFEEADFPCWARGVSHRGPYKTGPGAINVPISVCGQVVHPGDLVVGDEDGIVNFPLSEGERLLQAAAQSAKKEAGIQDEIANGLVAQSWLRSVGL